MKRSMRVLVLCALFIGSVLLVQISAVSADCTPNTVVDGSIVSCTATDNNGVGDGSQDNTTVTVNSGATVDASPDPAINLNNDNTIVNNGTVTNNDGSTIFVTDGNTITNNGTVNSTDGSGIDTLDDNTITNNGTINTDNGIGIDVGIHNTVTNNGIINLTDGTGIEACTDNIVTNNGTINSDSGTGIEGCFINTIVNNGTINADVAGVNASVGNTVTNNGTITSSAVGIVGGFVNTITNNGTVNITDPGGFGVIALDFNDVTNNGTINAAIGEAGIGLLGDNSVINNGSIIGGVVGIQGDNNVQVIANNGTITGMGGTAIDVAGGDDSVVVLFGSQINGTIDGGANTDSFVININAYADDTTGAQAIANAIAAQCPDASNCTINVNGIVYVVMNFEGPAGTHIILLTRAFGPKSNAICDGDVKVIKTVDGKAYDVFSGFSSGLPNGFWVGRVDLSKLPDTLKFQDEGEHNPGWYVGVTLADNNLITLQAYKADGTSYGQSCKVPR